MIRFHVGNLKLFYKAHHISRRFSSKIERQPVELDISKQLVSQNRTRCFFDVGLQEEDLNFGRIVFELYDDIVPRTCENFSSFCRDKSGLSYKYTNYYVQLVNANNFSISKSSDGLKRLKEIKHFSRSFQNIPSILEKRRSILPCIRSRIMKIKVEAFLIEIHRKFTIHRRTPFHRIVVGYWCQGGDVTKFNGTGGASMYGDSFDNENFELRHAGPGVLSMCADNNGRNDSKFNLTFKRLETVDGHNVVFGRIIDGMVNVYKVITPYLSLVTNEKSSWGSPKLP